jgi:hypothetical protein
MKKILVLLMALMLCATTAWADASTTTLTSDTLHPDVEIIKYAIIANTGGTVTAVSSTNTCTNKSRACYPYDRVGYIWKVVTVMGTPTPADAWDLTITDDTTGADLLGGEGANITNASSAEILPKIGNAYGGNILGTSFTPNVTDLTEGSSALDIYIYIVK